MYSFGHAHGLYYAYAELSWPYRLFWLVREAPEVESEMRKRGVLS